MSSYKITVYTFKQAKKLGVCVKPSTNPNKKIDVYKDGIKINSVGASGYSDYPTYIITHGKKYADKRRILYKARHEKTRHIKGSASYFADMLLW